MSVPLAHVGHWWVYVLYGIPVVVVLAAAARELWRGWRQRRERTGSGDEHGSA